MTDEERELSDKKRDDDQLHVDYKPHIDPETGTGVYTAEDIPTKPEQLSPEGNVVPAKTDYNTKDIQTHATHPRELTPEEQAERARDAEKNR
jgi:hypothetical protein